MPHPSTRRNFLGNALLGGAFAFAAFGPAALAAAIRVCPACGHEAAAEAVECSHCKAALPPLATAAPPPPPAEAAPVEAPDARKLAEPIIAEQVAAARKFFDQGAYWGAILFARNGAAMLTLQGRGSAVAVVQLEKLVRDCRAALITLSQPCPACGGTGSPKMKARSMKGDIIDQAVFGGKCAVCKGVGLLPARAPDDRIVREEAAALQTFAAEEKLRGLEETRGLWLPEGLYASLTAREQSAMRKAAGVPCATCRGFKSLACRTCSGAGILACSNDNCASGVEICPDCNGKGRGTNPNTGLSSSSTSGRTPSALNSRCATCNGTGRRPCQTCLGKGFLPCATCKGLGESTCKTCQGSGDAPTCTKCKGDGVMECTNCKGAGTRRGQPCEECRGAGHLLCKSCNGAGRTARR
jgi:hypothetical protein